MGRPSSPAPPRGGHSGFHSGRLASRMCFPFVNSLEHRLTSSRLLLGSHQGVWLRRGRVRDVGEGRDATSNAHRGQAGGDGGREGARGGVGSRGAGRLVSSLVFISTVSNILQAK